MKSANTDIVFSLDIGTRSIKGAVVKIEDGKINVIDEAYIEHEERAMRDGQIHNIALVAKAVGKIKEILEKKTSIPLENVAIAAAGRFLKTITVKSQADVPEDTEIDKSFIKALELTAIKEAEEEIHNLSNNGNDKENRGKLYCVGYSVKNYYLNGYTITDLFSHKGEVASVEIIATFLPCSVVDSLYAVMNLVNLKVIALTLEPIAAMEAVIPQNLRLLNLALIDIGAGTSDIAISNKDSIVGYGMVPLAGDEVTEVIAQKYFLDFNGAEELKKKYSRNEELTYTDVLGFEYTITREEFETVLNPVVENISTELAKEIVKLNGDKSPGAVFLVGGGAHTPMLKDKIAEKLELMPQRIAIKGREAVPNCTCADMSLGSIGVTVLGIAIVAMKSNSENFMEVSLNSNTVSLFTFKNHKVSEVLIQASINPKLLLARKGKNLNYTVNGVAKRILGEPPLNAKILINGEEGSLDSIVYNGDVLSVEYAKNGANASAKIYSCLSDYDNIDFYIDDEMYTIAPVVYVNGKETAIDNFINNGDNIEIKFNNSLEDFFKENNIAKYYPYKDYTFYKDSMEILMDYEIQPFDRITAIKNVTVSKKEVKKQDNSFEDLRNTKLQSTNDKKHIIDNIANNAPSEQESEFFVIINGKKTILKGKTNYMFIDIFDFFDFDRSTVKGVLVLKHNGKTATYTAPLSIGDNIEIYWEKH